MITALREIPLRLLAALGLLWLPFAIWNTYYGEHKLPLPLLLAGTLLIFVYIIANTIRSTRRFSHYFEKQKVTFSVEIGDLFDYQDGMAVSFSDTFDTALDRELINETSVQGLFTKKIYKGDVTALDQDITEAIRHDRISAVATDTTKSVGKTTRYPLGTVLHVKKNDKHYYLVALGEMSTIGRVQSSQDIFYGALCNLWASIDSTANNQTISIPLMGTGKSRLYNDLELAAKTILLCAYSYSRLSGRPTAKLRFVISKQDSRHVDMLKLKEFLKSLDEREA